MTDIESGPNDLQELVHAFPAVPLRIIAAVLAGYRPLDPAPGAALRATHRRLVDALADA